MREIRYEKVADGIRAMIGNGVLREGDKLSSVRQLSGELGVSVNTVKEAYWKLEKENFIESVPQSGFYVKKQLTIAVTAPTDLSELNPHKINLCRIYGAFQDSGASASEANLGIANIDSKLWPAEKLGAYFRDVSRLHDLRAYDYMMPPGDKELRAQIARLGLSAGMELSPDEIIITNGCHEAIFLSLMTVCKPGDTVAFESPIYYSTLSMLEKMGLKLIEIPSSEKEGMNLDTLRFVLENYPVKAVFSIPNFNNPLGFVMPDEKKKEMVRLLDKSKVTLIEDDVYGELYTGARPSNLKGYDTSGNVILCSSMSKTVAPGLRIGWVAPGRYYDDICNLKSLLNISTSSVNQIVAARFLQEGGYDRHMRKVRSSLAESVQGMRDLVLECFPEGTTITDPSGSSLLWVTMPEQYDSLALYNEAMKHKILIAPGTLFSIKDRFLSSFRINAGCFDSRTKKAVTLLGSITSALG